MQRLNGVVASSVRGPNKKGYSNDLIAVLQLAWHWVGKTVWEWDGEVGEIVPRAEQSDNACWHGRQPLHVRQSNKVEVGQNQHDQQQQQARRWRKEHTEGLGSHDEALALLCPGVVFFVRGMDERVRSLVFFYVLPKPG